MGVSAGAPGTRSRELLRLYSLLGRHFVSAGNTVSAAAAGLALQGVQGARGNTGYFWFEKQRASIVHRLRRFSAKAVTGIEGQVDSS